MQNNSAPQNQETNEVLQELTNQVKEMCNQLSQIPTENFPATTADFHRQNRLVTIIANIEAILRENRLNNSDGLSSDEIQQINDYIEEAQNIFQSWENNSIGKEVARALDSLFKDIIERLDAIEKNTRKGFKSFLRNTFSSVTALIIMAILTGVGGLLSGIVIDRNFIKPYICSESCQEITTDNEEDDTNTTTMSSSPTPVPVSEKLPIAPSYSETDIILPTNPGSRRTRPISVPPGSWQLIRVEVPVEFTINITNEENPNLSVDELQETQRGDNREKKYLLYPGEYTMLVTYDPVSTNPENANLSELTGLIELTLIQDSRVPVCIMRVKNGADVYGNDTKDNGRIGRLFPDNPVLILATRDNGAWTQIYWPTPGENSSDRAWINRNDAPLAHIVIGNNINYFPSCAELGFNR